MDAKTRAIFRQIMREIGAKGGRIGGKRSLETMTPEERTARAKKLPKPRPGSARPRRWPGNEQGSRRLGRRVRGNVWRSEGANCGRGVALFSKSQAQFGIDVGVENSAKKFPGQRDAGARRPVIRVARF